MASPHPWPGTELPPEAFKSLGGDSHQSHDHMGNRAVEKVVKKQKYSGQWGLGWLPYRPATAYPQLSPPYPREGDPEAGSASKLAS